LAKSPSAAAEKTTRTRPPKAALLRDPLWYKHAVIYEILVRAYADSNGDGIGDLAGLTSRLDFIRDLGVTAIWLMPFYPSPLRDGGYDIADYTRIHPAYGTMQDFKRLLAEAHARGIRVITELVINHTSIDHAWFQRARRAPAGSSHRNFYVWADSPERYAEARVIFKDFETSNWSWDPVAKSYYWHRFYSHQPDLNFDNPAVHQAVLSVVDFWLELGVDGLRLDAVPYLFEREGTNCENLPETHEFLRKLRGYVDAKYEDRMLLAEANQWPDDAAAYFGQGDECHMNFHFPLMPRMFMAVQMEDRFPIVDILRQTPATPHGCQWATFLRNHDELTLEMVTDEDRDYMYRVYTEDPVARINLGIRRRLAPLLKSRRKMELLTALLFALPGTPVLYYGDEIGMGDNVYLGDRDGVRTPMQWSSDRNAGFSRANPQRLYLPVIIDPEYHYESVNVEAQQANTSSLLWWYKRIIALRKEHQVFGSGDLEIILSRNAKVLAFTRTHGREQVLVVFNLSRHPQFVELDLESLSGRTPVEMFGRTRFPTITDQPYLLTLGPHGFFWFVLEGSHEGPMSERASLTASGTWTDVTADRPRLSRALTRFAAERRWFRGKARSMHGCRLADVVEATADHVRVLLVLLEIEYTEGEPETYFVTLAYAEGEAAMNLVHRSPHAVVAHLDVTGPSPSRGVVYDALATGEAARILVALTRGRGSLTGEHGRLVGSSTKAMRDILGAELPAVRVMDLEQSNSALSVGDVAMLKVLRQVEGGINAEIEVGTFLTEHAPHLSVPPLLGSVVYRPERGDPCAVALVHRFVQSEGNAWDFFTRALEKLFEHVLASRSPPPPHAAAHPLDAIGREPPEPFVEHAAQQFRRAAQLGRRTAEVHAALASGTEPEFAPELFTLLHQRSIFQRARSLLLRSLEALSHRLGSLPEASQEEARALLGQAPRIEETLREMMSKPLDANRIRTHGDFHLGQVLFTGDDFVLIDFEGEPARPLRERRYKRNALRDAAGMLRSFAYAAEASLRAGRMRHQDEEVLRPWASAWSVWIGGAYLQGYLEAAAGASFVPADPAVRRTLLDFYTMEKAIYELSYELANRPDWLPIPIRSLFDLTR
jgi:maltose alpha-D-glucosyltransferase/alpha-amylase